MKDWYIEIRRHYEEIRRIANETGIDVLIVIQIRDQFDNTVHLGKDNTIKFEGVNTVTSIGHYLEGDEKCRLDAQLTVTGCRRVEL